FRWSQMAVTVKGKNTTTVACDPDTEQQDLAGRLATLALRAHSAARSDCSRLGAALANTLGELARTAANRQAMSAGKNQLSILRIDPLFIFSILVYLVDVPFNFFF
ncbi:hypothetical protein RR48_00354, partial [Papilio machaon]